MGNPYAKTFMIATRMDNPRLYEFEPPKPRQRDAEPETPPARRRFWGRRR